jgi:UDP-N-acetyl-D-mannosaminuronic acid dehydrogenase
MIISVIGLGYIGLPTAAILASKGIEVIGVEIDQSTINTINQGKVHIVEPELDSLVRTGVQTRNFRAVRTPQKSNVFIIAVPTPFLQDYSPDLSYIKSAINSIAPVLEKGNTIILESTSPVGTTEKMVKWMQLERPDLTFPEFENNAVQADISVAYCPERVLPGHIIRELVENDRIVGGVTTHCAKKAIDIYRIFVKSECMVTDCRTAELGKLVENSFRDVNIAFANELSLICDRLDVDVWDLIKLTNHHPRVNILQPGPGVGGHCIAVDPWFIINSAPDESKLIHMARLVNNGKPKHILKLINKAIDSTSKKLSDINITCLGISFKADINDLRESPALEIVKSLCQLELNRLNIVEPNISTLPNSIDSDICSLVSLKFGIEDADIVVVLVDHSEFKLMDESLLVKKHLVDTRGIFRGCGVKV